MRLFAAIMIFVFSCPRAFGQLEFNGFSEKTTCEEALDLEQSRGAELQETVTNVENLPGLDGYWLSGMFLDAPVKISFACVGNVLHSIYFESAGLGKEAATKLVERYLSEVRKSYEIDNPESRYFISDYDGNGELYPGATPMESSTYSCVGKDVIGIGMEYPRGGREDFVVVLDVHFSRSYDLIC